MVAWACSLFLLELRLLSVLCVVLGFYSFADLWSLMLYREAGVHQFLILQGFHLDCRCILLFLQDLDMLASRKMAHQ
mgnify:CR=1 FL=1